MLKMKRSAEKKKTLQDPMKRLESIQRRQYRAAAPPTPRETETARAARQPALIARQQIGAPPAHAEFRWMGREDGGYAPRHECFEAGEVPEDLELASVTSDARTEPPPPPLQTFASDGHPRARLARRVVSGGALHGSAVMGRGRAKAKGAAARVNNFMSPPASPGSAYPVGSALHAARATRALH